MAKVLFRFQLRSINKFIQFTGFRIAVMYDTNDDGSIISGQPVKMALVWWGFKDFLPLVSQRQGR